MSQNQALKQKLKDVQSRFFNGNVAGQKGRFVTKEDADNLRDKVTKPLESKKFKKRF